MSIEQRWNAKKKQVEQSVAMPEYYPALFLTFVLFFGGMAFVDLWRSLVPLALAWGVGVILMLRYGVTWQGKVLVRRKDDPAKFRRVFSSHVLIVVMIIAMELFIDFG